MITGLRIYIYIFIFFVDKKKIDTKLLHQYSELMPNKLLQTKLPHQYSTLFINASIAFLSGYTLTFFD